MKWIDRFELRPGKWVHIPSKESRKFGKELIADLRQHYRPPSYFYHLQKGGHVAALKNHYASIYFCRIDLKDFFEHITSNRISRSLKRYYGSAQALHISRASTVPLNYDGETKSRVPFGFPQSPLLSSIVLDQSSVGRYLRTLSRSPRVEISVYVDDITLSGNDERELLAEYEELICLCARSRFTVSTEKSHPPRRSSRLFNIDISQNSVEICAERMSKFVAAYREPRSIAQQEGIYNYVGSINIAQLAQLP